MGPNVVGVIGPAIAEGIRFSHPG